MDKFNLEFNYKKQETAIQSPESDKLDLISRNANEEQIRNWKLPLYSELSIKTILENIWMNWVDVFSDILQPKGRSLFDAFWIKDRPFYIGITFIIVAIIIQTISMIDKYI